MAFGRCKHTWRIEDKTILPAPITKLDVEEQSQLLIQPAPWMFEETLVMTMVCTTCGKINRQVTRTNPPAQPGVYVGRRAK